MRKILIVSALLFLLSTSNSQIKFEKGSLTDVIVKAKSENKVLMVDVLTDWCVWCVELDIRVYSNPKVSEFANTNQINYKIDAEKGEGVDFKTKYAVTAYPTILFLDSDGKEIDRIIGYYPAKDFYAMMVDYNKGINTFKVLKATLEKDPNDIFANLKIADKYISFDQLDKAREHLNKIIEIDPKNLSGKADDAKYMLASISGKETIISNLETFINEYPESDLHKDADITLAESYNKVNNDITTADNLYKEALNKYPDDENVKLSYGRYLIGRASGIAKDSNSTADEYRNGLVFIEEALPYVTNSFSMGSAYYNQSRLYYNLKEYDAALQAVNKALKIFDNKYYRELKEAIEKQLGTR